MYTVNTCSLIFHHQFSAGVCLGISQWPFMIAGPTPIFLQGLAKCIEHIENHILFRVFQHILHGYKSSNAIEYRISHGDG